MAGMRLSTAWVAGVTQWQSNEDITIRLPDVEVAMLVEVQKRNLDFRNISQFLVRQIRAAHAKL